MVRFSKYKFYNKLLDGVTLLIYIYSWVQVTPGVTLSNVTPPNNLLMNLYFENFIVGLHVLYLLNMHINFHINWMLFTIRSIYSSFMHYFKL